MADMETIKFKGDLAIRRRLFVADAMQHPAKGHIAMWQECIERYSKEGDTLLDPMAGVGTSLVAALMGRNIICGELERQGGPDWQEAVSVDLAIRLKRPERECFVHPARKPLPRAVVIPEDEGAYQVTMDIGCEGGYCMT